MKPTSFVWDLDEINIQVKWQFSARVLVKQASNQIKFAIAYQSPKNDSPSIVQRM
jgi:hypothetical protein